MKSTVFVSLEILWGAPKRLLVLRTVNDMVQGCEREQRRHTLRDEVGGRGFQKAELYNDGDRHVN